MKIAMLTSWQEDCGVAEYSKALVAALRGLVEIEVVPLQHGQTGSGYFRELGRACNRADLVHIQHEYIFFGGRHPWNYYWPRMISGLRVPFVATAHTRLQPFRGGPLWKRAARRLRNSVYRISGWGHYLEAGQFRRARRVIVHTAGHREALIRRGLAPEQVIVLPQGIPESLPLGDGARARQRWGLEGPVVTLFGFVNPAKGHLVALKAWELARPEATLVIAGKVFSARDEAYAQEVGRAVDLASGRVKRLGFLEAKELADLLAASDLVLMPYTHATSSYALSLALAQGCTVLASDLDYFKEVQNERPCLALFHANDASELSRRMAELLTDEERRWAFSREARMWAQTHGWKKVAEKTVKIYETVLLKAKD